MRSLTYIVTSLALVACGSNNDSEKVATGKPVEPGAGGGTSTDPGGGAGTPDVQREEHAVWELGPNRHLAHRIVDGDLVVDAGSPGFARFTKFGMPRNWIPMQWTDDQPTARIDRSGSIDVPLTDAQATAAKAIAFRVHAAKAGKLTVKINNKKLDAGRVSVATGWQDLVVPAEGVWKAGENMVTLESNLGAKDLHFRWFRVAHDVSVTGDPLAATRWDGSGFALADGGGVAWYVLVPDGAVLAADVDGACKIAVSATDGDGGSVTGALPRVDLAKLAGKVVRLELRAEDCAAGGVVKSGRVLLPGAAPAAAPEGTPPKYVFFWVMDALRADRVATFTPGARAEVPNFDKLAADGAAIFRQHYVGGNESQVSHSSMFSSLYPAVHEVRTAGNDQKFVLDDDIYLMGQAMKDAGYYTIGVTANGMVIKWGGYAKGFDEYRNAMRERGAVNARLPGKEILDDIIGRLEKHKDSGNKLFFFMGTVDTHSPWVAREPWMSRLDPGPYDGPFQTAGEAGPLGLMKGKMGCHKIPPQRDIERLRTIYDSAISYQDDLLGQLLAKLEALGIADESMIVITADHGEELFEEKRCGHGASLRDTLARVPLLVHYPKGVKGRVVDEGSEGIDILPTILDTVGAPVFEAAQGESLLPLAAGTGAGWARPSFASQYEYAFAVRLGRWKARFKIRNKAPMVLDMVADPDERTDLADTRMVERRYLTDHLSFYLEYREEWHKTAWGVVSNMTEAGAAALEAKPQ